VGLDPTNPVTASPPEDDWQASFLSGGLTTLARLGGVRVVQAIRGVDSSLLEQGYSRENVDKQAMLTSWNVMSPEMVRQRKSLREALEQTKELRFTQDLPVLVFTSRDREKREGGDALRAYAGEGQCHRVETLDASHYVHHEQHTRINEVTRVFLAECGRMTP
jgi:predicted hydrolase or acyltransferase of alpha/beta superfamily